MHSRLQQVTEAGLRWMGEASDLEAAKHWAGAARHDEAGVASRNDRCHAAENWLLHATARACCSTRRQGHIKLEAAAALPGMLGLHCTGLPVIARA